VECCVEDAVSTKTTYTMQYLGQQSMSIVRMRGELRRGMVPSGPTPFERAVGLSKFSNIGVLPPLAETRNRA
jgi:hypothetical protein